MGMDAFEHPKLELVMLIQRRKGDGRGEVHVARVDEDGQKDTDNAGYMGKVEARVVSRSVDAMEDSNEVGVDGMGEVVDDVEYLINDIAVLPRADDAPMLTVDVVLGFRPVHPIFVTEGNPVCSSRGSARVLSYTNI
jgi:hypothetical protein